VKQEIAMTKNKQVEPDMKNLVQTLHEIWGYLEPSLLMPTLSRNQMHNFWLSFHVVSVFQSGFRGTSKFRE